MTSLSHSNKEIQQLRDIPLEQRLSHAHPFLRQVVSLAQKTCHPQAILLFGSRARGDHRRNSDFDLAFKGVTDLDAWSLLVATLLEDAETLCSFDLLRFEEASESMQKNIEREGVLICQLPTSKEADM